MLILPYQIDYSPKRLPQAVLDQLLADESDDSQNTKRRVVFRFWPRAPTGKPITPQHTFIGKQTPNGIELWGSTLLDFYRTQRFCHITNLVTISTGSKLLQWMKHHGETDTCADEIKCAEAEDSPQLLPVYDHAKLILESEDAIRKGDLGKNMDKAMWAFDDPNFKNTDFDPEKYPAPWPLEPFSYPCPILRQKIPYYRLPKKLLVHATQKILQTDLSNDTAEEVYRVYEYKLILSTAGKERMQAHHEKHKRHQKKNEQTQHSFKILPDTETTPLGPIDPVINVIHPPPPELLQSPELAHLYISQKYHLEDGSHSQVYKVELELPRDTLVPDLLCSKCAVEEAKRKAEEILIGNEKGIWEKEWRTAGTERQYEIYKQDNPDTIINTVKEGSEETGEWVYDYKGPLRNVKVDIESQNPYRGKPHCQHISPMDFSKHPPTTRVTMIAKLSKPNDPHLKTEAENYQQFPEHLFEHWSGYNIIPPLHDPTPVGAVVPQFYGYYVPVGGDDSEWKSPILLMEHCGSQIDLDNINADDKNECASLVYRMHEAGWSHRSVYQRNIVQQPGPLWKHPSKRGKKGGDSGLDSRYSYRLIDFGRSKDLMDLRSQRGPYKTVQGKSEDEVIREDMNALDRLFQHLYH